jgi:hypothetical protein
MKAKFLIPLLLFVILVGFLAVGLSWQILKNLFRPKI